MAKILSIILALAMMLGINVPGIPEARSQQPLALFAGAGPTEPQEGYSLFVSYEGFDDAAVISHIQSETPYYVIPENPRTVKEGYTFKECYNNVHQPKTQEAVYQFFERQ